MQSGPPPLLFACNTQWKCIGDMTPPPSPRHVRTKWKAPDDSDRRLYYSLGSKGMVINLILLVKTMAGGKMLVSSVSWPSKGLFWPLHDFKKFSPRKTLKGRQTREGGGLCFFEGGYSKPNYRSRFCATTVLSPYPCWFTAPCF